MYIYEFTTCIYIYINKYIYIYTCVCIYIYIHASFLTACKSRCVFGGANDTRRVHRKVRGSALVRSKISWFIAARCEECHYPRANSRRRGGWFKLRDMECKACIANGVIQSSGEPPVFFVATLGCL